MPPVRVLEVAGGPQGVPKVPLGCRPLFGWAVQRNSSIQQSCSSRDVLPKERLPSAVITCRDTKGDGATLGGLHPGSGYSWLRERWGVLWGALGDFAGRSGCSGVHWLPLLRIGVPLLRVWVPLHGIWVLWGALGAFIGCRGCPFVGSGCPFRGSRSSGVPWVSPQDV